MSIDIPNPNPNPDPDPSTARHLGAVEHFEQAWVGGRGAAHPADLQGRARARARVRVRVRIRVRLLLCQVRVNRPDRAQGAHGVSRPADQ
jgi:hypothetical protein